MAGIFRMIFFILLYLTLISFYGFDTAFISEQMLPEAEQNLLKRQRNA